VVIVYLVSLVILCLFDDTVELKLKTVFFSFSFQIYCTYSIRHYARCWSN